MKLAYVANWGGTIHAVRWVNAMAARGHEVHLISVHPKGEALHPGVTLHLLPFRPPFGYFLGVPTVRGLLKRIGPDLLHIHRASGYGTLGSLTGFHPRVLSVWGADVYDFPTQGGLSKSLVMRNLLGADWICSTSRTMAEQTHRVCPGIQHMSITPFGIDMERFQPDPQKRDPQVLTIGTVKTLESRYGIDLLIQAFAQVRAELAKTAPEVSQKLRLLIAGSGSQKDELEALIAQLGLKDVTKMAGRVPHHQVPDVLNRLDIYVAASRSDAESFGVAVLEASSCALPVVVANVGGLPEVVEEGVTGFLVERESAPAVASALMTLVNDPELRQTMGAAGRELVRRLYDWEDSVTTMEEVYAQVLALQSAPPRLPTPTA